MPITYEFDRTSDHSPVVVARMSGAVTPDEVRAFHEKLLADPGFQPGYAVVLDVRRLDSVASPREMEVIGAEISRLPAAPGIRYATVADAEAFEALSRIDSTAAGSDRAVFRDVESALRWTRAEEGVPE